ncbi:MAG: hypothetical protein ACP5NI_03440 [Acetobacteraceae bacterium]
MAFRLVRRGMEMGGDGAAQRAKLHREEASTANRGEWAREIFLIPKRFSYAGFRPPAASDPEHEKRQEAESFLPFRSRSVFRVGRETPWPGLGPVYFPFAGLAFAAPALPAAGFAASFFPAPPFDPPDAPFAAMARLPVNGATM